MSSEAGLHDRSLILWSAKPQRELLRKQKNRDICPVLNCGSENVKKDNMKDKNVGSRRSGWGHLLSDHLTWMRTYRVILQHMLSFTASCHPTSLSAPLAPSSSSSSISCRSSARRFLSAWVKRSLSPSPLASYCVWRKENKNHYWHYISILFMVPQ